MRKMQNMIPCKFLVDYEDYSGELQLISPSGDQDKEGFLLPCPHKMLPVHSMTFPEIEKP